MTFRRSAALAILLLGVVGVGGDPPAITDIQIVPARVVVGVDAGRATTFELEARVWGGAAADPVSITEKDGYSLDWTVSAPWLTLVRTDGFRAWFRVGAGAAAVGPASVTVTPVGKSVSASAEIAIAPGSGTGAGAGGDDVQAAYVPDLPPDAVLVRGARTSAADDCVSVSAFVARAAVGSLVGPCGRDDAPWGAAVLSPDHAMVVLPPVPWTPGADPLDVRQKQDSPRSLPLALRVMIAPDPLDDTPPDKLRESALAIARDDIAAANVLLAQSRAGIALSIVSSEAIDVSQPVRVTGCSHGDAVTGAYDLAGVLNVYYVNGLFDLRGLTCDRHDGRNQAVIYAGWDIHWATTFVHELGHALGLMLPGQGHTDRVRGFDRTDIMTSGDNDTDRGGRHRLTVGQVFRMNVEPGSWLNAASWPALDPAHKVRAPPAPRVRCQCGSDDPAGGCPALGDDVAPRSARPDGTRDSDCGDQIHLDVEDESEDPVAVLAGLRWGEAPGDCSADVQGVPAHRDEFTFVRFENLADAGKCPAWAAVFFREHGVVFLPLTDPNNAFTPNADEIESNVEVPERTKVQVQLYFPGAEKSAVKDGEARAGDVFGSENRTGIRLDFKEHKNKACPAAAASSDIVVCWLTGGVGEGQVSGRRIEVHGGSTLSTLSHFIGRALQLPVVTGPTGTVNGNVMQADVVTRGTGLTLNQVLQLNAVLRPGLCGTEPCPVLGEGKGP